MQLEKGHKNTIDITGQNALAGQPDWRVGRAYEKSAEAGPRWASGVQEPMSAPQVPVLVMVLMMTAISCTNKMEGGREGGGEGIWQAY